MTERPPEIKTRPDGQNPEVTTDGSPKVKSRKLGGRKPTAPQVEKSKNIHAISFDRPVARPAQMKSRHRGLVLSLVLVIALPVLLTTIYLTIFAQPQYASQVGFTIRQEETGNASDLMGGLSGLLGSPVQSNADLLFEYVQSQEIVERIDAHFDLIAHYTESWPRDPVFSIWPTALIEDVHWFWNRMVRLTYDKSTGMMLAQVRARDPASAQRLAHLIVAESELMINRLNETARRDTMRNAEFDLETALERLRSARQALSEFRARTQILDPQADIQGRMGVLNVLQQQLAEALVEYDLLMMQISDSNDPRLRQMQRRIEVVRNRINEERRDFTQQDVTGDDTDYPRLIAQYEGLLVDQTFAEATYQAALTAFDAARSNASRQTLYLANFIQPSLAQRAQYPQTILIIALTAGFMTLIWSIMALVYYSLRDRG
ncbi:capsular polysaccharide transport system permease protein [Roseinatronobacter thiooxidans]|uniref:Capsular polysaccharide transport system permease protein n=1 Tax=Roseinatronobacter thiooxidans TaxID=121821 RepID=A0A2W7RKB0_9RHOB|nr:sugar transporter [Roseinatronobacter thiooxidans]PZX38322.1 capsular polysaccharide transport system permease protein [Roseinatronobacter thiooxidans]